MQYTPVHVLYELAGLFAESERDCKDAIRASGANAGNVPISAAHREQWGKLFEKAIASSEFMRFVPFARGTVERLVEAMRSPTTTIWETGELLRDLQRRMVDELEKQVYLQIDPSIVFLTFQPTNGWDEALGKYPEIRPEVIEASMCLVCDRWTACVFHSMRILELGLRSLALEVGVAGNPDLENWKNIIDQVEKKIRDVEQEPRSTAKSQRMQRYSELANQFRYFKDAWRNHVVHARAFYDSHQAASIYSHVRDFMRKMAETAETSA